MKRVLRVIIMIVVLLGMVGLAQNQLAWAATSPQGTNQSALSQVEKSILPSRDDCDKDKNSDKCKDKDKDKDKCKKHKEDCGTVKPPPHQILIPVTGEYSVGGFCTISTEFNDPTILLDASIETPLPRDLPEKVHKVRQGCHLIYYASGTRIDELSSDSGTTTICFAATPQKQMTIYFNNIYAPNPTWAPLETTVQNGTACATGNTSGVYVATFQTP
jgi:hypothetical protein